MQRGYSALFCVLLLSSCVIVSTQDENSASDDKDHDDDDECDSWVLAGDQTNWNRVGRAFLYGAALIFLFLGVAIISDIFMQSIEQITSEKEVIKLDPDTQTEKIVTIETWNETVANLTLLALGSSAPEILLNCIETVQNLGEKPGELGPSTIVGSAAYNLFVILSICVGVVKPVKKIKEFGVFVLTSIASLFAYFWMLVVLKWWTPDEVTVPEALLTFSFFPLLVGMAYMQDHGWFIWKKPGHGRVPLRVLIQQKRRERMIRILKESRDEDGSDFPSQPTIQRIQGMAVGGGRRSSSYHINNSRILRAANRILPSSRVVSGKERGDLPLVSMHNNSYAHSTVHGHDPMRFPPLDMPGPYLEPLGPDMMPMPADPSYYMNYMRAPGRQDQHYPSAMSWMPGSGGDYEYGGEFSGTGFPGGGGYSQAYNDYDQYQQYGVGSTGDWMSGGYGSSLDPVYGQDYNWYQGDTQSVGDRIGREGGDSNGDVLQFMQPEIHGNEREGVVHIPVQRHGSLEGQISCQYSTQAGNAYPGQHYVESGETNLVFGPGEAFQEIVIQLLEDQHFAQDDLHFYVLLHSPSKGAQMGSQTRCTVTVVDDDRPDAFNVPTSPNAMQFSKAEYTAMENDGAAEILVMRYNPMGDECAVFYQTHDGTAHAGVHYQPIEGMLVFGPNEQAKHIHIPVTDESTYEKTLNFSVSLSPVQNTTEGHCSHCNIIILHDQRLRYLLDRILLPATKSKREYQRHERSHTWAQQFKDALRPVGDDNKPPKRRDYLLHGLSLPWKLLFALTPPTVIWGGWATFFVALIFIGALTAVIAEFASLFGCVLKLGDATTAITFVALGTSLPDTFASKKAAQDEEYADAAVGNVTGSNSVNVFLGLGLPWCIAAIYNAGKKQKFEVPQGDLTFTVMLFIALAVPTLLIMFIKRKVVGGELGGRFRIPVAVVLFLFWVGYITLSILRYKAGIFK
eukprot:TRINITY_DN52579_c0_g1_i1.p1 TRINITY_DN52579_c0_g1~~TRINITY_DN52579_c0_g1_i1.p1  ORF type:complete len:963 (-),score=43.43 TRINITY_DN52579_c0_g1_i1:572-3460(-)